MQKILSTDFKLSELSFFIWTELQFEIKLSQHCKVLILAKLNLGKSFQMPSYGVIFKANSWQVPTDCKPCRRDIFHWAVLCLYSWICCSFFHYPCCWLKKKLVEYHWNIAWIRSLQKHRKTAVLGNFQIYADISRNLEPKMMWNVYADSDSSHLTSGAHLTRIYI